MDILKDAAKLQGMLDSTAGGRRLATLGPMEREAMEACAMEPAQPVVMTPRRPDAPSVHITVVVQA
jgi:hypothetical protein